MDLFIRSQNKEQIVKAEWIKIDENQKVNANDFNNLYPQSKVSYSIMINGYYFMGTYENRKRAFEVLDDIQSLLIGKVKKSKGAVESEDNGNLFYQMPEN